MINADDVIAEIRESRRQMSRECDHDVHRYIAHLKALTQKFEKQVETFQRLHDAGGATTTPSS